MMITKVGDVKEREVVKGIRGRFVHSENMTVAHWTIDAGAVMPDHAHPHEQIVNVIEGEFDFTVEGKIYPAKPGFIAIVPPNVKHGGKAKTQVHILDVFYPVREDYRD